MSSSGRESSAFKRSSKDLYDDDGRHGKSDDEDVKPPATKRNKPNKEDECIFDGEIKDFEVKWKGDSNKTENNEARSDGRDAREKEHVLVLAAAKIPVSSSSKRENEPTINNVVQVPTELLARAFEWLSFKETRRFFCGSRVLWKEKRFEYESQMLHELVLPATPPCSFLTTLDNVHTLDFGPYCTNSILEYMQDEKVLPKLKHLSMARSVDVTDEGLAFLGKNPVRCRILETLNIMYCPRMSYGGTLDLRDALKALVLLRRQPEWMDGIMSTDLRTETLWPDGTFLSYDKDGKMDICAYRRDMLDLDSNSVICKNQYVFNALFENEFWRSRPQWMRHAYRDGWTFLHLPNNHSVLCASQHRGIYPPPAYRPQDADTVPIGTCKFFTRQGDVCAETDTDCYAFVEHHVRNPLDSNLPPQEVVEMCRSQVQEMAREMSGMDQADAERQLHVLWGGQESDTPPTQWF